MKSFKQYFNTAQPLPNNLLIPNPTGNYDTLWILGKRFRYILTYQKDDGIWNKVDTSLYKTYSYKELVDMGTIRSIGGKIYLEPKILNNRELEEIAVLAGI